MVLLELAVPNTDALRIMLPQEYIDLMKTVVDMDRWALYKLWDSPIVPPVGQIVNLPTEIYRIPLPLKIKSHSYYLPEGDAISLLIKAVFSSDDLLDTEILWEKHADVYFMQFIENGWTINKNVDIKKILKAKGLPSSLSDYSNYKE